MHPSFLRHLLLQQRIHHPVPCRLHLALKSSGRDGDVEVGFGRGAIGHGAVVRVEVGVVADLEGCGFEGGCYLDFGESVRRWED